MDRWLEKDLTIKVLSVILALAMWFQVTSEQNPLTTRTFKSVPVKPQNLDQSLVLIDLAPKTISATIQGQRRVVNALKEEDITAFVDLKAMEAGKASLPVDVVLPRAVQLVEVLPNQVTVTADSSVKKRVRVEIRSMGSPAEDYMALPGQTKVTDVTIEGPRSRVSLVAKAVADVDVTGAAADVVRTVPLRALDVDGKEIKDVTVQPKAIEVRIPMRKLPPAKTVAVKVDILGPPKEGFKVTAMQSEPQTVRIRGPAEVLAKIDTVLTRPVDIRGVASDFDRQIEILLPPGISLVEPKSVLARVSIAEDRIEKTIAKVPVQVKHLPATLKWSVTPSDVSVTVEGQRAIVEKLGPKNIEVFVDALGLYEGDHGVSIQVSLPQGVALVSTSVDVVTLNIRKK